jgi:hypothetical protein
LPAPKPLRFITQKQWLERLQCSLPCLLKYERCDPRMPKGRDVCGRTMYVEQECDEYILNAPIRPLR